METPQQVLEAKPGLPGAISVTLGDEPGHYCYFLQSTDMIPFSPVTKAVRISARLFSCDSLFWFFPCGLCTIGQKKKGNKESLGSINLFSQPYPKAVRFGRLPAVLA